MLNEQSIMSIEILNENTFVAYVINRIILYDIDINM